jgi:hypothetical protein
MPVDDQTRLMTLNDLLEGTEFVLGEDGAFYATFCRDGRQVTYPTFSPDFLTWIRGEAAERLSSIPSTKIIKQAIELKEHKVRLHDNPYPVAFRFYADETSAVIHLSDCKILEIHATGAIPSQEPSIETGIVFPTRASMKRLPEPEDGDVLDVLPELLGLSEEECLLVLSWLMSSFQADGKHPILIITGPRQSGKTRMATILRQLLDPHRVPLLRMPEDDRELKTAVLDNAVLAFDDVAKVPLQKELLALAAGTAFHFSGWSQPVQCKRPIIMVCKDLPDAPDLLENAIILRLKDRPAEAIKSKPELDRKFCEQHPKALGSLVKACSLALKYRKTIKLDAVHIDAELERWNRGLDQGLNLGGKMLAALRHNLEQTLTDIVKERPATRAFLALVKAKGAVKKTATQLLEEIEPFLDGPKDARYPTSGKQLAKLLRDYKRFMTDIEIDFDVLTGKNRDRNIVATWHGPKPTASGCTGGPAPVKVTVKRKKAEGFAQDQPMLL